ncbi:hypothetical protein ACFFOS_08800 [Nocardioides kongjuensis]|uniref:Uncharacterized protein n=1 Tax=Nocardioides kongjuensis TaxID=349522 RepID=A0A852RT43_9ACTN|nr:hypothetical protein [Nocardioides kongjuensis]NYD31084.1 hypothetical protein [Nocardioides kongjuensis]
MTTSALAPVRRTTVRAQVADLAPAVVAGSAVTCLLLHLALLAAGGRELWAMSLPMLALSLLCVGCVPAVWRHRAAARSALAMMAGSGVGMVLVHLGLEHTHDGATAHVALSEVVDLLMHGAVTLAASQVVLAALALICGRHHPRHT